MGRIDIGVDTFSLYHQLSPTQVYCMVKRIKGCDKFQEKKSDYFSGGGEFVCRQFADQGVTVRIIEQKTNVWGLYIIVHPSLALGETNKALLYQPKKKTYTKLMNKVYTIMQELDCQYDVRKMKLYRVDITADLFMDCQEVIDAYIHILKKSMVQSRFHVEKFKKEGKKANDYKSANAHSYKQSCKSSAIFAYDKIAQLKMVKRTPQRLIGKNVLRIEIQNRRRALKRWVGEDNMDDNWAIIRKLATSARTIINWYFKKMRQDIGSYYRYDDAVKIVCENTKKKRMAQMVFLLRKTSDCGNLNAAVDALKSEYNLNSGKISRIFKAFKKLNVSPITLPNISRIDRLQSLGELL